MRHCARGPHGLLRRCSHCGWECARGLQDYKATENCSISTGSPSRSDENVVWSFPAENTPSMTCFNFLMLLFPWLHSPFFAHFWETKSREMFSSYDGPVVFPPATVVGKDFTQHKVFALVTVHRTLNYRARWLLVREAGKERASSLHFSSSITPLLLLAPSPHLLHPLLFLPSDGSTSENIKVKNWELLALNWFMRLHPFSGLSSSEKYFLNISRWAGHFWFYPQSLSLGLLEGQSLVRSQECTLALPLTKRVTPSLSEP